MCDWTWWIIEKIKTEYYVFKNSDENKELFEQEEFIDIDSEENDLEFLTNKDLVRKVTDESEKVDSIFIEVLPRVTH